MFILRGTSLGERVCCLGTPVAVDCEDESVVLELPLMSTVKTSLWFWNSHWCRLRRRVCGSGTPIAVDSEDESVVLELPLMSTVKTSLWFWNSHWCRLRRQVWVLELPLLSTAKRSVGSGTPIDVDWEDNCGFWNLHCYRLGRRERGSGTLIAVYSILLLEWYYKKQKQFIVNVMEYWKLSASYPSSRLAGRFRYVLRCSRGGGGGGYSVLWPLRVHTL